MGARGPSPTQPTPAERAMVELYAAMGYTQEDIAALLGKSESWLKRRCKAELTLGGKRANAKIGGKLFQKAMAGDTASLIFWAKTRMGWRETNRTEHTGPGGGPVQTVNIDLTEFLAGKTETELAIAESLLTQLLGAATGGAGLPGGDTGNPEDHPSPPA